MSNSSRSQTTSVTSIYRHFRKKSKVKWVNCSLVRQIHLIIDCSVLLSNKRINLNDLTDTEYHSRRLLYVLHTHRYRLLKIVSNRPVKFYLNPVIRERLLNLYSLVYTFYKQRWRKFNKLVTMTHLCAVLLRRRFRHQLELELRQPVGQSICWTLYQRYMYV